MILCFGVGCSSTPQELPLDDVRRAMGAADQIETLKQYAIARDQLTAVLPHAEGTLHSEARLRICALWQLEGPADRAAECYADVVASLDDPEARALASYRLIPLREGGDREIDAIIERFPQTDGARRALTLMRGRVRQEGGVAGEVTYLLELAERLEPTGDEDARRRRLRAGLWVEAGRLRLEALDDPTGALGTLEEGGAVWTNTVWADDAQIWWARALRRLGDLESALEHYRRIIDDRESSWIVGSYDSVHFDEAFIEAGQTLEEMGRIDDAVVLWLCLEDEAPTSRLIDDAEFFAARAKFRRGQRAALQDFVEAFPDSRYQREARALLESR